MKRDGNHYIYEVGIDNVNTGEDLVNAIVNGVGGNTAQGRPGNPLGHYTKFMPDAADKNVLWIYDDRASEPAASYTPAVQAPQTVSWIGWTNAAVTNATNAQRSPNNGKFR